jgi:short-subunit dehydrogenase
MNHHALLVGNSDGIGLVTTRRLLNSGWNIIGISRSQSPIADDAYQHHIADVSDEEYPGLLEKITGDSPIDLCIYFVGIGELLNPLDMSGEPKIIDVNLVGMVKTASAIIPGMIKNGKGHFIGLSSVADELISAEAPSYHASKAGFSNYLNGLGRAVKSKGVFVTNVRFGFVDTKMAKGDFKPFMMTVDKTVDHLEVCLCKKPANYTAPKIVIPLIKFRKWMMKLAAD